LYLGKWVVIQSQDDGLLVCAERPVARNISHAKAQRRNENPAKRGSALRRCAVAREIFIA